MCPGRATLFAGVVACISVLGRFLTTSGELIARLDGAYGHYCLWAFNSSQLVTGDACQLGLAGKVMRQVRLANEHMHLHQWGLNMLQLGGHRGPPPAAASSGGDLWVVDPHDLYVLLDSALVRARES
jgi:hypothetical protein